MPEPEQARGPVRGANAAAGRRDQVHGIGFAGVRDVALDRVAPGLQPALRVPAHRMPGRWSRCRRSVGDVAVVAARMRHRRARKRADRMIVVPEPEHHGREEEQREDRRGMPSMRQPDQQAAERNPCRERGQQDRRGPEPRCRGRGVDEKQREQRDGDAGGDPQRRPVERRQFVPLEAAPCRIRGRPPDGEQAEAATKDDVRQKRDGAREHDNRHPSQLLRERRCVFRVGVGGDPHRRRHGEGRHRPEDARHRDAQRKLGAVGFGRTRHSQARQHPGPRPRVPAPQKRRQQQDRDLQEVVQAAAPCRELAQHLLRLVVGEQRDRADRHEHHGESRQPQHATERAQPIPCAQPERGRRIGIGHGRFHLSRVDSDNLRQVRGGRQCDCSPAMVSPSRVDARSVLMPACVTSPRHRSTPRRG